MKALAAVRMGSVGVLSAMMGMLPGPLAAQAGAAPMKGIIAAVQDADYRADLPALRRLPIELEPLLRDPAMARAARYWRGFALWRRALNAANLNLPADSILVDLDGSLTEFSAALAIDTSYVEAKIGAAAVLMNAAYFRREEAVRSAEHMRRALRTLAEVKGVDPDNPRLVFVAAARTYWAAPESGGDRRLAIQEAGHALRLAEARPDGGPTLEPTWGVAELHMQLAFFHLNLPVPELDLARRHAQRALDRRPDWQYVRDMLLPQIEAASQRRKG
jgi:hypothetical protein